MNNSRVRIAYFVSPSRHFAGIERVVHEIATGLMEEYGDQLDVHVIYSSRYEDPLLERPFYKKHVLGSGRLRGLARALRATVARVDADVLVCPQIEASVVCWFATRGLRLPLLVPHLHGNPRIEHAEGTRRTRVAFGIFAHVVARRVPAVLVVSPTLGRHARAGIARRTDVFYAPNPVRRFPGADGPTQADDDGLFRFVTVARLARQKGQDQLLRAVAAARAELPPFRVTLVGSGDTESDLRALCTELGLDDVVAFTGEVPDPTPYLRAADCFVLPSRWEGFGLALVEALQFGLPLLATDCEFGPADVITDPRIGDLVPNGDLPALAAGLVAAARREPVPGDVEFRRAVARGFDRGAAAREHRAALGRIVVRAESPGRLDALAGG